MGIIWNLQNGPATFRQLQQRCESISPSILNSRIKDLREADIVKRTLEGYQLTQRGRGLFELLLPFGEWSLVWADEVFNVTKHAAFESRKT